MTTARNQQICLEATAYYHCVSRCVRRAFLCGLDEGSGVSYEHRRSWVEDRLFALAKVFCIDLCAYAIMSNHYHLVLHIHKAKADSLSDSDVIDRWLSFHNPPVLIQRYLRGDIRTQIEYKAVCSIIQTWRQRLYSISWFMRLLNQFIATEANKEDGCSGHFWEGRFKSQALLDDKALAAAMAYVDLNPVRAGIAETPETSNFTSVKSRLDNLSKPKTSATYLYPFIGQSSSTREGIPYHLADYLGLLDWIGRHFHEGKTGQIAHDAPPILKRLGLDGSPWLRTYKQFEKGSLIGAKSSMTAGLPIMGRKRISGTQLPAN
ncbi:transposase [Photobacterium sp. Hal280]|uniref:transposase n=1 Tax=Photobacterium sp. Hal280 TaxID=3035163 RepID=UPI00301E60C5